MLFIFLTFLYPGLRVKLDIIKVQVEDLADSLQLPKMQTIFALILMGISAILYLISLFFLIAEVQKNIPFFKHTNLRDAKLVKQIR